MRIANNDFDSLYKVLEVAEKEIKQFPEDEICSDGTEVFASHAASSSAPSGTAAGVHAS